MTTLSIELYASDSYTVALEEKWLFEANCINLIENQGLKIGTMLGTENLALENRPHWRRHNSAVTAYFKQWLFLATLAPLVRTLKPFIQLQPLVNRNISVYVLICSYTCSMLLIDVYFVMFRIDRAKAYDGISLTGKVSLFTCPVIIELRWVFTSVEQQSSSLCLRIHEYMKD